MSQCRWEMIVVHMVFHGWVAQTKWERKLQTFCTSTLQSPLGQPMHFPLSFVLRTHRVASCVQELSHLKFIDFFICAHGGTRDKKTGFLTNVDWFDSFAIFCNKQHTHAPWTPRVLKSRAVFPTHSEVAYPEAIYQRIASLVKNKMLQQGAMEVGDISKHVQAHDKSRNRVVWGMLPRGRHIKLLVSKNGIYIYIYIYIYVNM